MKKYNIIKLITGVTVVGLLLSSCSSSSDSASEGATAGSGAKLCVIHNNADHPSITALTNGVNDEAKVSGMEVSFFDPAMDPQKQVSMIEDCIAAQFDVIAVNAVDPVAVIPAIKKAKEAGIKVITVNANVDKSGASYIEGFIGSQSFDQGYAVGLMIAKALNNTGNIVLVTGNPGQTDAVNRTEGMKSAFKNQGANIKILAEQTGKWSKDEALKVMTDMLTKYPKIDAVFGHDDPMALGALAAVNASGRTGIKAFGVNGNKEACESIKSGEMFGTALQLSYLVGVYAVRAAYDLKAGRLISSETLAPTAPVTPENIDQWMEQCW
jgi:ABC-type sugar transport system substrate-binding protein